MLAPALVLLALATATTWWLLFRSTEAPPPTLSAPVTLEHLTTKDGERSWKAFVPATLPASPALLLALHGSHGDAEQMRRYTGHEFERLADEHGFIVAYPEGFKGYWNDARIKGGYAAKKLDVDDVAFLRDIAAQYRRTHHVQHVFAVGYSNGGYMCIRMALDAPESVDAIATFGANMPTDDNCVAPALARPFPVMLVNGTRDPIAPFQGGRVTIFGFGDRGTVRSALASAEYFAAHLRGEATHAGPTVVEPVTPATSTGVDEQQWTSPDGAQVRLFTIHGGGHTIPQPRYRFAGIVGRTEMRFNAPAACWDFFSAVRAT